VLREIVDKVWGYCEGAGIRGRTVTLKVKFANFQIITRSRAGQTQISTRGELELLCNALLEPLFPVARGIRLLGISLSWCRTEQNQEPVEKTMVLNEIARPSPREASFLPIGVGYGGHIGCGRLATTIAIAIAPGPKPNDDHSSASDLATSASAGGHRRVAVDASC